MTGLLDKLAQTGGLAREEYLRLLGGWQTPLAEEVTARARETARRHYGRDIYLRGLIEVSNHCKNDCRYCGIRAGNRAATRYRLSPEEIYASCAEGWVLGLRTFVLQGGEDPFFTEERVVEIVQGIKARFPGAAVTLSLGEWPRQSYEAFRAAGADRYLLRHETADAAHYGELHPPPLSFENRRRCLFDLRAIGFQTGAGLMVGSPGQSEETLAADLLFLQELQPQMVGIGPFIPHADTPLAAVPAGSAAQTLYILALVRLLLPTALLPATTALGTVAADGWERGVLAGANVIMPNLTPPGRREHYQLYNDKNATSAGEREAIAQRMEAIGYRVTDSRGDHCSCTEDDPKAI